MVVVDCGRVGGGAKLWVLIVVVEKKSSIIYDNFLPRFGVFQKQMTSCEVIASVTSSGLSGFFFFGGSCDRQSEPKHAKLFT